MTALGANLVGNEDGLIIAKSGLMINVLDDEWQILPNKGKGHVISVGWIHRSKMPDDEKKIILEVLVHYVRMKNASTATGIVHNTRPLLSNGIPPLVSLKAAWSGLKTNNKKGLNQFFGTLSRMGYKNFEEYHQFTSKHLDRNIRRALDPMKGALSDVEFDSLAKQININLQKFDWSVLRGMPFYLKTNNGFGELRNCVSNKLILSIVRRPIQIAMLKWSDLIPVGAVFDDPNIQEDDHIMSTGVESLQLRVFYAKSTGLSHPRSFPERYPLSLTESLSGVLMKYKSLYFDGVMQCLNLNGIIIDRAVLLRAMMNMPIFISIDFFSAKFESLGVFTELFTNSSTAFHVGENIVTAALRNVVVVSDRRPNCTPSNNRIRHAVLTRGAQAGLPVTQLAKITGVTVPAVRHYIDIDYESRKLIDKNYIGNAFLKQAFRGVITLDLEGEDIVFDNQFNEVGGVKCKTSCARCSAELGRPLGCYGCPNFRPILEANHRAVLQCALDKLSVNKGSILSGFYNRSIEKLQSQVEWIRLTVSICDEMLMAKRGLNVK
ncbi:hypothetical protein [Chitinibacter tainanensis]|uniref:hypothetical protein n=1 Tax=Chitinibacter tainanensis TaxID=230667 RepID=UPI0023520ABA|nr:hypothetical protein [Chitinibacter tainanensis]